MKIAQSAVFMLAGHQKTETYGRREKLDAWIGPQPGSQQTQPSDKVTLDAGCSNDLSAAVDKAKEAYNLDDADENLNPHLSLVKRLIELFTGHKIKLINPSQINKNADTATCSPNNSAAANASSQEGWGVRYDLQEFRSEREQTEVSVQGVVKTVDGKEINFNLQVQMNRSYTEQNNISIRLGDATRIDPLVVNFNGTAAQLSDWKFNFDLNADGVKENIPFVASGSGVLVFDRSGDKQVNDGSELFGPSTGNGFAELAALDDDKNGWIDENDSAYAKLAVWQRDEAGNESLMSLADSNIGALNVGYVDSPFDLKDENNNLRGQILGTGLYLSNAGNPGTMQQLDVTL